MKKGKDQYGYYLMSDKQIQYLTNTLPQAWEVKLFEQWIQIILHILYNFAEVKC